MNLQKTPPDNAEVNSGANQLTSILFVIYLIAIGWILLLKLGVRFSYMETRSINLIPYSEPLILNGKSDVGEIILNILVFVPLGIYAGILFKRWTLGKKILFFFLISLIIEAVQYTLAIGAFDITDFINNTLGGIIGLIVYKGIEKAINNRTKAQKFINLFAALGTALVIILLLLLKLNLLPVRYQ